MPFSRIRDAIRTLSEGGASESEARFRRLSTEATELVVLLNSVLEKATMLAAREARRNARRINRELGEEEGVPVAAPAPVTADSASWKAAMIRNAPWQRNRAASAPLE